MTMPTPSEILAAAAGLRQYRTLDLRGLPTHRHAAVRAATAASNAANVAAADVLDRVFAALITEPGQ